MERHDRVKNDRTKVGALAGGATARDGFDRRTLLRAGIFVAGIAGIGRCWWFWYAGGRLPIVPGCARGLSGAP